MKKIIRKPKKTLRHINYLAYVIIITIITTAIPIMIVNAKELEKLENETNEKQTEEFLATNLVFTENEVETETIVEINLCDVYADSLLQEGTITEEEAEMLKQKGHSPENPWINFTEEDVLILGDAMDAEECILRSTTNEGKRAHLLAGSVMLHRIGYEALGIQNNVEEVLYCISPEGNQQYGTRTIQLLGKRDPLNHNHEDVYEWARDLLIYGPIGPENLIWQGSKQGEVYDKIGTEYFGLNN